MPQVVPFIAGALNAFGAGTWVATAAGVGAFSAGFTAASWLATSVVGKLLTSVALSALSSALAPRPRPPGIKTSQTQTGGTNPCQFVLGKYATGGYASAPAMSHGKTGKTENAYLTYVLEVSDAPVSALSNLIIDGQKVTIGTTADPDYGLPIEGDFADRAWVKFYTGTQTAADPMLIAKYADYPERPWKSDMIGRGLAYAVLTFRYDREVYDSLPSVRFVVDGLKLYDPRQDSTVGGSGAQRWATPSTWAFTRNPIVMIYNIMRGITLPDGNVWGGNCTAADLPVANWIAAMNVCDVEVTLSAGGTIARYTAGFEVSVDDEPAAVIEELLKACNGQIVDMGGVWKVRAGSLGLPVYFFTDEDIIATRPEEFDPFPGLAETFNGISATYPEPTSLWESREAPPRYNATWEAEDGNRRLVAALSLPAVSHSRQVQHLMNAAIKDHRRMRRHNLTLTPAAAMVEPLDVVSWTSVRNGYAAKSFEVAQVAEDLRSCLPQLAIREVDPTDYDWSPSDELPDVPAPPGVVRPATQAVPGFSVSGISLNDADGVARRPALQLIWDGVDLDDAEALEFEIRRSGTTDLVSQGSTANVEASVLRVAGGILPATAYEARARLVVQRKRAWTSWISATTPSLRLGPADLDWSQLENDILGQLADLEAWINGDLGTINGDIAGLVSEQAAQAAALADQAADIAAEAAERGDLAIANAQYYRDLARSVETLRDYVAELDYQSYTAREELRQQIGVVVEGYAASFDQRITVAASDNGAIAERVTVLEAETDTITAQIIAVDTARVDGENALAQQIAAVSVGTNTQFDPAKIWYFDSAADGWTGSPSDPTASGGYLRPAIGTGAYITSPAALAVASAAYPQVRARLRRVGTPAWTGYLWWQATGAGWDAARRVSIAEPTWVDGVANITITPEWAGQIDQIRLDLATAPDATNYVELDWVAIGSPAPGASRAELVDERTARISADSAQAAAISDLEAELTTLDGATTANANAVQALDGRVTTAEGLISSQATAITALEAEVSDIATAASVAELRAEVDELSDGVVSQSSSITALRSTVDPLAAEGLDAQFAAYLDSRDVREANASADEQLRTNIAAQGDTLTVVSEKVTSLEATVPGLATSSAVQALTTRVTVAEGSIVSQASSITSLQSDVAGKASATALDALTTEVSEIDGDLVAVAGRVLAIEVELPNKASASALSSLTTRVTEAEGDITSLASDVTALETTVAGKASATAVNALTTRVTEAEGDISAQADAITALNVNTGRYSAGGRFRVTVHATPEGATSRIGLSATAAEGDANQTAAFFLEATAEGASRALINASRFAVINGTARDVPFIVDGGITYIKTAFIKDLTVDTIKLANGAVSVFNATGQAGPIVNNSVAWTDIDQITLSMGTASFAQSVIGMYSFALNADPSAYPAGFAMRVLMAGVIVAEINKSTLTANPGMRRYTLSLSRANVSASSFNVTAQMQNAGGYGVQSTNLWAIAEKK